MSRSKVTPEHHSLIADNELQQVNKKNEKNTIKSEKKNNNSFSNSFFETILNLKQFRSNMFLFQKSIDSIFLLLLFINLHEPEKSFLQLKEKKFYNYIVENQNNEWGTKELIKLVVGGKLKELKLKLKNYKLVEK